MKLIILRRKTGNINPFPFKVLENIQERFNREYQYEKKVVL